VIKGGTDEDLDPSLAEDSWRKALALAQKLGEQGWANRARGELGLVAFLQGDINTSVIQVGEALKVAQTTGDAPSVVRWSTLFGDGYVQLGRPEEALDFYDRALQVASTVPGLEFPLMTYVGKGDALVRLGRDDEAERILNEGVEVARKRGALGYQAELMTQLGLIAQRRKRTAEALDLLSEAVQLARRAGGNRILAEAAMDLARVQRTDKEPAAADRTLQEGIDAARAIQEHLLLPRLLADLADVRSSQRRYADAAGLLDEASDLLEGLFTHASSPWLQSRLVNGMNDVFLARIRLEGERGGSPTALFAAVEQARGRPLLELLLSKPLGAIDPPEELQAGEKRIAALQVKLFQAKTRAERRQLLDQIFVAEEQLAPISTELFDRSRHVGPREQVTLAGLQRVLRKDELFLEFALTEPDSYCIVATHDSARVQRLPARAVIQKQVEALLDKVRSGEEGSAEARTLAELLLPQLPDVEASKRIIISPDGDLHQLPFELLVDQAGHRLLESHIISYTPSGSVLTLLRNQKPAPEPPLTALAVSASPAGADVQPASIGAVQRSVYDLDGADLRPLPSAADEARAVASILGPAGTKVLVGDSATELDLKHEPLQDYRVVHFAVHAITSSKFPARAALLLQPGGGEDGLLQAREILLLRFHADLVTLSACDTGSGPIHGEDGVSSLVRPFLAAGARAVVANLWAADDTFSLALMKEFYRQLAGGMDVADALRRAKLRMLEMFGPQAVPKLWSGVLAYGDASVTVPTDRAAGRRGVRRQ